MDWMKIKEKIPEFIRKYRYVMLILLVGIILMAIPSRSEETEEKPVDTTETSAQKTDEERLEEILMQINGAGKVKVMLTLANGEETIYQTDDNINNDSDSLSTRRDTVTVTDSDRVQSGLVRQINPPTYLGAVVVCQGADKASVRLAIIEAVSKVTDLGADRISVLKMK